MDALSITIQNESLLVSKSFFIVLHKMLRKCRNIEELLKSEFAIIPTNWFSDTANIKE